MLDVLYMTVSLLQSLYLIHVYCSITIVAIPSLKRLQFEDQMLKASMGYMARTPSQGEKKRKHRTKQKLLDYLMYYLT